ncbi:MAG: hypothetical protein EOP52_04235 [Sphingobacteriales bacterium]|nr:MAG: hypothetical protein EOP52_04235 [Sphingobacteriales bacterium]
MNALLRLLALVPAVTALTATAQTTYLPSGSPEYELTNRLETLSGSLSNTLFTTQKGWSRKELSQEMDRHLFSLDSGMEQEGYKSYLTDIDQYQIGLAMGSSAEWNSSDLYARKPVLKHFYETKTDLFRVKNDHFFLSVNPVLGFQGMYEKRSPEVPGESSFRYLNTRGAEVRATIANRIGVYTFITDNQERMPWHLEQWTEAHQAVPGADYYQTPSKGTYDYLQARGYVDVAAVRNHVNVTFGYDRNFLGDGERSLLLSDFASSGALFARIRTKIWKLQYENLYLELTPQYQRGLDQQLPHKYATIHHLSVNATRWLNVGLFEAVVFGRADHFSFAYLNPIIFLRQVERMNGSPDNAFVGLNFKAIAAKRLQFYGQLLLDELKIKELTAGNGWWGNKFGVQLGGRYFNAFGIKNLDLQGELNLVRPFTYGHNDTLANYTHYNQPLAHPLEAGFVEVLGKISYRPAKKWQLTARGSLYRQGTDSGSANAGVNIFRPNTSGRLMDYGYSLTPGPTANVLLGELAVSWEPWPRLFLDAGVSGRTWERDGASQKSLQVFTGLRLNLSRRDYLWY